MVVDLDLLDQALRDAAAQVDGADLETIQPADAEAVTVEVFARWLHGQLSAGLAGCPVRRWPCGSGSPRPPSAGTRRRCDRRRPGRDMIGDTARAAGRRIARAVVGPLP